MKTQTCGRQITLSKICHLAILNQISNLSSENKNIDVWQADKAVKTWGSVPISNSKPDLNAKPHLHNVHAHTKYGENPLIHVFTQVIIILGNKTTDV